MIAKSCFGGAPVSDSEALDFIAGFLLRFIPIEFKRRIAFQVERLLIALTKPGVEYKLGRATRVAHALCLSQGHVVAHAMLWLASREALQERGSAIFKSVENRTVQLRRVGDGNLCDKRRAVPGEERFGHRLFFYALALSGRAKHVHVAATKHGRGIRILP